MFMVVIERLWSVRSTPPRSKCFSYILFFVKRVDPLRAIACSRWLNICKSHNDNNIEVPNIVFYSPTTNPNRNDPEIER